MTKEWSHLPNAEHIDWVLDTLKKNPEVWGAAWNDVWDAAKDAVCSARDAERGDVWDAARGDVWDAAWDAARNAARNDAWDATGGAIAALIAWDESSELLTMPITHVERLAKLEMPAAILLLPAVIVKHNLTFVRNKGE